MFSLLVTMLAASGASIGIPLTTTASDDLGRFPSVEGANLEGRRMVLPADFEGALDVVVIAFQREQQRDVDSWMPFLNRLAAERRELKVYELPTLGRRYRPIRSFIDGGMRRGIPDAAVRAATVTLYIDKSAFRRALRLDDEDRIYVLLVDPDAHVHWRASGPFDANVAEELRQRVVSIPFRAQDSGR